MRSRSASSPNKRLTAKLILVNEELKNRSETSSGYLESAAELKDNNEALEMMLERGFRGPYEELDFKLR